VPFLLQASCFDGAVFAVCNILCLVRATGDEASVTGNKVSVAATFTIMCFTTAAGGEALVMATFTGLFFITAAGDEASRIAAAPIVRQSKQKHHSNKIL
jgi:hypothetical protein